VARRPSGRLGMPVSAAARGPVSAAADTASPLDCPRRPLGRQATASGPPSAWQRARTDAAPCLPSPPPKGLNKEGTGFAVLCPCRGCLPPHNPLLGALRIADAPAGSAAVPLLSQVLCGLSSLLVSVWNVLPPGSCVKAWPCGAHQQDRHRRLAASAGRMAYQAGRGAVGPWSRALGVPGTGAVHACRTRCWRGLAGSAGAACPPTPRQSLRSQGRSSGLSLAGLYAADRDAVEGFPWRGRPRGGAPLGGRSPGLPLAAAVFRPGKATHGNLRSLLRQGQASLRSVLRSLDTRSLRLASRRKDGKHKLQQPAAYRPGERRASFSPPPLETQRPWEAQPPLRVAAAHSPQKNTSKENCFFRFVALRAGRRPS